MTRFILALGRGKRKRSGYKSSSPGRHQRWRPNQELITGKTIGRARENDGVYLFEENNGHNSYSFFSSSRLNKNSIWYHHYRLGHLSFKIFKCMFPSLSYDVNIKNFIAKYFKLLNMMEYSFL